MDVNYRASFIIKNVIFIVLTFRRRFSSRHNRQTTHSRNRRFDISHSFVITHFNLGLGVRQVPVDAVAELRHEVASLRIDVTRFRTQFFFDHDLLPPRNLLFRHVLGVLLQDSFPASVLHTDA
jgi:hypothetical protein